MCDIGLTFLCISFVVVIWGGFLEAAEVSLASSEDQNFKGLVLVKDLFPFVPELVDSLLMNLESSIDSPSLACPLLTYIGDFTAIFSPCEDWN
jgi:E3 ubiquitin-protein ligase NEDD4